MSTSLLRSAVGIALGLSPRSLRLEPHFDSDEPGLVAFDGDSGIIMTSGKFALVNQITEKGAFGELNALAET